MPSRNLLTILLSVGISVACYHEAARGRYAYVVSRVIDTVSRNYVQTVEPDALLQGAIQGITEQLDPYSAYIPPVDYQQFEEILHQKFGGIGVQIGVDPQTQHLLIISPLPNTPALSAGLRGGDLIVAIDGVNTEGISIEEAVKRMRGKRGEPVELTIRRPGREGTERVVIRRDIIQVDSVLGDRRGPQGRWIYPLQEEPRIAVIRVSTFGDRTTEELASALRTVAGQAEALVLDLRGNAGGLLKAAVEVADLFVERGEIVSIRGRDGRQLRVESATRRKTVLPPGRMPIAVLVNQGSASASEIVAAALQDHKLAVVVGQRTFGKGTVQNLFELNSSAGALKLTIATYWRPSGTNIHRHPGQGEEQAWGVRPDPGLEVALTPEQLEEIWKARQQRDAYQSSNTDTANMLDVDPQLNKAVEYLLQQLSANG